MKALISHKRARFDFEILEEYEAGIELLGTEVKSIRSGSGKLEGGHIIVRGNEAYLVGISIPAFQNANMPPGYESERPRRLLLTKKQIALLEQRSDQQGLTIVPIMMYNKGSTIKLQIAIARGKKKTDKRQALKARDTKRDIERTLKNQ